MKQSTSVKRAFSYLRWSTDDQTWGDSERRQTEMARRYCREHGLQLCEQVTDRGVSAFRGANRNGELGRLLGVVRPGDVLLIEDADRLSRQDWRMAINLVGELVDRGIEVVTP